MLREFKKEMKILHLNLYRCFFDAIVRGEKRFEYRRITQFWTKRIEDRKYDVICFRNGYSKSAPEMLIEYLNYEKGKYKDMDVYILKLGAILELKNYETLQQEIDI
jgi:hypothetical protein